MEKCVLVNSTHSKVLPISLKDSAGVLPMT